MQAAVCRPLTQTRVAKRNKRSVETKNICFTHNFIYEKETTIKMTAIKKQLISVEHTCQPQLNFQFISIFSSRQKINIIEYLPKLPTLLIFPQGLGDMAPEMTLFILFSANSD